MYNCIVTIRPASYNSWRKKSLTSKANYKTKLVKAFEASQEIINPLNGNLYGVVYYFHRIAQRTQYPDADNLSKPIWDCLKGTIYEDDQQVKFRIVSCFDLDREDIKLLNFKKLPIDFLDELIEALENNDHILYIECGDLQYNMYQFNFSNYAN